MKNKEQVIKVLDEFKEEIHQNAVENGFWSIDEEQNIGEKIALIHSELSEALEAARKDFPADEHCPEFDNFTVELGDAIIRIFDLAGGMGLPLAEAMLAKIEFNKTRPPKHGKRF